jgi:hypothetical protein
VGRQRRGPLVSLSLWERAGVREVVEAVEPSHALTA